MGQFWPGNWWLSTRDVGSPCMGSSRSLMQHNGASTEQCLGLRVMDLSLHLRDLSWEVWNIPRHFVFNPSLLAQNDPSHHWEGTCPVDHECDLRTKIIIGKSVKYDDNEYKKRWKYSAYLRNMPMHVIDVLEVMQRHRMRIDATSSPPYSRVRVLERPCYYLSPVNGDSISSRHRAKDIDICGAAYQCKQWDVSNMIMDQQSHDKIRE